MKNYKGQQLAPGDLVLVLPSTGTSAYHYLARVTGSKSKTGMYRCWKANRHPKPPTAIELWEWNFLNVTHIDKFEKEAANQNIPDMCTALAYGGV